MIKDRTDLEYASEHRRQETAAPPPRKSGSEEYEAVVSRITARHSSLCAVSQEQA